MSCPKEEYGFCEDGNCIGCKDGQKWCQDPRCSPFCRGCSTPEGFDIIINIVFLVIVLVLILVILLLLFFYGPRLVVVHDGDPHNPKDVYEANRPEDWGLRDVKN